MKYMCTNFGVGGPRHFIFIAHTHRQSITDATDQPTHALVTAGVNNNQYMIRKS